MGSGHGFAHATALAAASLPVRASMSGPVSKAGSTMACLCPAVSSASAAAALTSDSVACTPAVTRKSTSTSNTTCRTWRSQTALLYKRPDQFLRSNVLAQQRAWIIRSRAPRMLAHRPHSARQRSTTSAQESNRTHLRVGTCNGLVPQSVIRVCPKEVWFDVFRQQHHVKATSTCEGIPGQRARGKVRHAARQGMSLHQ